MPKRRRKRNYNQQNQRQGLTLQMKQLILAIEMYVIITVVIVVIVVIVVYCQIFNDLPNDITIIEDTVHELQTQAELCTSTSLSDNGESVSI